MTTYKDKWDKYDFRYLALWFFIGNITNFAIDFFEIERKWKTYWFFTWALLTILFLISIPLSKSLERVSDRSFIFRLDDIPIMRYSDKKLEHYNWQKDINSWIIQYIGWFVSSFDWTSIEEIIIAWE